MDALCNPDVCEAHAPCAELNPGIELEREEMSVHATSQPAASKLSSIEPKALNSPDPHECPINPPGEACITPMLEKQHTQHTENQERFAPATCNIIDTPGTPQQKPQCVSASCDVPAYQAQPRPARCDRTEEAPSCTKSLALSPQHTTSVASAICGDTKAAGPHSGAVIAAPPPLDRRLVQSATQAADLIHKGHGVKIGTAASSKAHASQPGESREVTASQMDRSLLDKVFNGLDQPEDCCATVPNVTAKRRLSLTETDFFESENVPPQHSCKAGALGGVSAKSSTRSAAATPGCDRVDYADAGMLSPHRPTPPQPRQALRSLEKPAQHHSPPEDSNALDNAHTPYAPSTGRAYDALVLLADAADSVAAKAACTPATSSAAAAGKLNSGAATATTETCPPPRQPTPISHTPQHIRKGAALATQHAGSLHLKQRASPALTTPRPPRKRSRSAPGSRTAVTQSPSPQRHLSPRTPALASATPAVCTPAVSAPSALPLFKESPPVALFVGQQPHSLPCTPVQVTARSLLAGLLPREGLP
jgi:hypothetical protein